MTSPATHSLHDRIAALGKAETFSEVKQTMLALVECGEPEALEALFPRLLTLENENLLGIVGRAALGRWGDSVLSRIELSELGESEKENALRLCRWEGGDMAQAILSEALQDASANVRHTAARLLGELPHPNPSVYESLEKTAMGDEDVTVRRAAARAIAAGNDPNAIPILERVMAQAGDEKVEDLLIDLRLRVIERMHPGLIPPREQKGNEGRAAPPPEAVKPMGRLEYFVYQTADQIREVLAATWAFALGSLKTRGARDSISPWRVAMCLAALLILAFAGLHYRETMNKIRPRPERTVFTCTICGAQQEGILGPSAQCRRCGAYVFGNRALEDEASGISFSTEKDTGIRKR